MRVLDCTGAGTSSSLIQGINWLTTHCSTTASKKCVANLSLSFSGIAADVEAAIQASVKQGVSYVVAAGNANTNACDVTPARVPEVVTVGASTQPSAAGVTPVVADSRADFSNYGPCEYSVAQARAVSGLGDQPARCVARAPAACPAQSTAVSCPTDLVQTAAHCYGSAPRTTPAAATAAVCQPHRVSAGVDLFAPGVNIMSSYYFAADPTLLGSGARLSGTSQVTLGFTV